MSLKDGISTIPMRFMGSLKSYDESKSVMLGVPMDFTSSFRPGSRFAPQKIREVSYCLEEYSVYLDKRIDEALFYDCGDLDLPFGDTSKSIEIIQSAVMEIINDEKFPLFIGGEHLITLPVLRCLYNKYGNELAVLHFDAHADLREGYLGVPDSHASVMRRACEFIPGRNIYQFGIRSGEKNEFEFAEKNTNMFRFEVLKPLQEVISQMGKRPVYVTLDIDVLDPAYANGTGTPEPGGITSKELFEAVYLLEGLNLIGFDLVEVCPPYDQSDRTAVTAAKVIREVLIIASNRFFP
jgi:agmatinase